MQVDIWSYRDASYAGRDITGFSVEALDGSIGKIDKATNDTTRELRSSSTPGRGSSARRSCSRAGVIDRVDGDEEKVWVNRTKDQIKNAPEYDDTLYDDEAYRGELAGYYGPGGRGYRDWPLA